MTHKYQIRRYVSGSKDFVEISKEEFEKISVAKVSLFQVLFIEDKLDIVLENFFEFEESILNTGLKHMIFRNENFNWIHAEKRTISRKLINLLSSCRFYVDQVRHLISNIFGKESEQYNEVKELFAEQYDESLGYRVMDALRNYVQHKGPPIHEITIGSGWIDPQSDKSKLRFHVIPILCVSHLNEDKGFKASVLTELRLLGKKHDVRVFLRDYISCIGTVHKRIREILKSQIADLDSIFENAIKKYEKEYTKTSGLVAAILKEDDSVVSRINLFTDQIKLRRKLERKNSILDSMLKRYVTSEIVEKEL